jgi:hypothetical protein
VPRKLLAAEDLAQVARGALEGVRTLWGGLQRDMTCLREVFRMAVRGEKAVIAE